VTIRRATADETTGRGILKSRHHDVDGLPVHVVASRRDGDRLVVLVPGLGLSWRQLEPLARELTPEVAVYAVDLPGFGWSGRPATVLDVGAHATVVGHLVDLLAIPRVALLGSSFGCHVVVEVAARADPAIASVVLQGPPFQLGERSALWLASRALRLAVTEDSDLRRLAMHDYRRSGIRRVWATACAALRHPIERRLRDVRVPALVVHTEDDALVTGDGARRTAELLPEGELAVLARGGHSPGFSAPRAAAGAVAPFIARTLPPSRPA